MTDPDKVRHWVNLLLIQSANDEQAGTKHAPMIIKEAAVWGVTAKMMSDEILGAGLTRH